MYAGKTPVTFFHFNFGYENLRKYGRKNKKFRFFSRFGMKGNYLKETIIFRLRKIGCN